MRVVVDAGHGGPDPGAISPIPGIQEKDLTIKIAHVVAAGLRELRLEVRETRIADERVRLSERVAVANEWPADLAVSIHCNADDSIDEGDLEPSGFEVWCWRRSRFTFPTRAFRVAQMVQESMRRTMLRDRGVKTVVHPGTGTVTAARARYWVGPWDPVRQIGTRCPAILVETGFLTSRTDAKFLRDNYRDVALAIIHGVTHASRVVF